MTKEEQISRVFPRLQNTDIKHQKLCFVMQEYADQQTEALKKEVEALMSTINKLSGGTLSGILEEEITQLKKQLKEYVSFYEYCKEQKPFVVDRFVNSLKENY